MGLYAIFNIVTGFAMLLLFIRFMMQLAWIEPSNPYASVIIRLTAIEEVFQRIFKPLADGRISVSCIVLMFMVRSIDIAGNLVLANLGYTPLQLLYVSTTSLILDFLDMATWVIIGSALASIFVLLSEKSNSLTDILMELSEPLISPFRKLAPDLGMLDLSPMIALFALIFMEIIVKVLAENMLPMLVTDYDTLILTAKILSLI